VKAMKNKIDYSRFHDIEFFYNMAYLDQEMSGFFIQFAFDTKANASSSRGGMDLVDGLGCHVYGYGVRASSLEVPKP